MENFTLETGEDGVALVTFDIPGRSMNTISHAVQRELGELADTLRGDDRIVGAVLRSGKPSGLCAGADLHELRADIHRWAQAGSQEELRAALTQAGNFSRRVRALETVGKPLVALLQGVALGGGLELALGCHHRIAIDNGRLRLGLPEARLGLMPGAGGTQRLLRLVGITEALPWLLDGTAMDAPTALTVGVIHAIASEADALEQARQWIVEEGDAVAPWDVKGFCVPGGGPHGAAGYTFGPAIAARRGADRPGESDDAILKALYEGAQVPIDAGLRIESRYFLNLLRRPGAAARIDAFLEAGRTTAPAD